MKPATTLVTSSRMPFAVDEIRKFGQAGHRVIAADSFAAAPGNHSRHADKAVVTPAPADGASAYLDAIIQIIDEHGIELLVPCFEEVFYLARHRARLDGIVDPLFSDFATLTRLHDKVAFTKLCSEIGLPVVPTHIAHDRAELDDARREFLNGFFSRPAFSRGGLDLFTNRGQLAGELVLADCNPTNENPWLVQPFLKGEDRCCFAIAQHGRLVAHVSYVHPQTIDGAGGISFESIDDPELVSSCRRLVEASNYHGQISLDFMRTADGLIPIECNPRATAGVALMSTEEFAAALGPKPPVDPIVTPAGRRRMIGAGILREMVRHWSEIPTGLKTLAYGGKDIYASFEDPLPGLYQFFSYTHVIRYRMQRHERRERCGLMAAYFHDLRWDGQPIP
jgi:predicted ATP-grasp superfamily ATP-dependent carboligase